MAFLLHFVDEFLDALRPKICQQSGLYAAFIGTEYQTYYRG